MSLSRAWTTSEAPTLWRRSSTHLDQERLAEVLGGALEGDAVGHATTLSACPSSSAWPRARPGSSTSAACARSSSTGCSRAGAAGAACCGSRTPTRAARSPSRSSRSSASLRWLGIDWDGPVSFQLDRMERCEAEARRLVEQGAAYEDEGAIRFRMPDEGVTGWDDAVRGRDRVPERAARGPRARPLGRPADLQLRLAGRGLARRDHPRDPRPTTTSRTRRSRSTSCARSAPSCPSTRTCRT